LKVGNVENVFILKKKKKKKKKKEGKNKKKKVLGKLWGKVTWRR